MEDETKMDTLPQMTEEEKADAALNLRASELEKDLDALSENYGVNILAAVSFTAEKQTAVFYSGEQNLILELGLASVITRKFK